MLTSPARLSRSTPSAVWPASRRHAPGPRRPIGLLGVPFDNLTKAEAVVRIGEMIAAGKPSYVVTANVDFLVQARSDVELRRILIQADLVLCDGTPLLWASRWLGNPLPERAAGSDVVPLLLAAAAEKGHRIFLLGAAPDVAAEAADKLRERHPTLIISGHYSPPYNDLLAMDFAEIERHVRTAKPDVVLVSFGCPKQEKWIAKNYVRLGVPVMIGVGATLDFIAGRIKRAPLLMQRTGTECLFRLAQEPRRLARRYAGDLFHFAPAIARQWWRLRAPREAAAAVPTSLAQDANRRKIREAADLGAIVLERERACLAFAPEDGRHCLLDLSRARFVDSTGVAILVQWRKRLHDQGRRLMLLAPSIEVRRALDLMGLTNHFGIVGDDAEVPWPVAVGDGGESVVPPFPGGHTVAWRGEVTSVNTESVWNLTRGHLAAVGPPPRETFIINLARLEFIDSAGAELMGRMRDWAGHLKKDLRYLGTRPDVRNVLLLAKRGDLLQTPRR